MPSITEKILTLEQADAWVEQERAAGSRIGFTCGAFDVLHAGHAQYLERAKALCDRLLVAINSDESIRRYKNPLRPVNPWKERAFAVAALESCDRVTVLDEDRPLALIQRWKPDLYLKGGDYASESPQELAGTTEPGAGGRAAAPGRFGGRAGPVPALRSAAAVESYGGRTVVIPAEFASSTTAMFERIQALSVVAPPAKASWAEPRGLVLLDLDGTVVRDATFDPTKAEILPGVIPALKGLQEAGFRLCLVTNQQGIGLGFFGYRDFVDGCRKVLRELGQEGIAITKIYFCPHSLGEACGCRKPSSGLILRALREQNVPPERTFLIGDSAQDMEAASVAGCRGLYVGGALPAYHSLSIEEAARNIIRENARSEGVG